MDRVNFWLGYRRCVVTQGPYAPAWQNMDAAGAKDEAPAYETESRDFESALP